MPELPEVETVRRTLAPAVEGRTITAVSFAWPPTCVGDPRATEAHLAGQRVERLERYGKYLLLRLSKDGLGSLLVIHLRMTGNLLVNGTPGKHTRASLTLDDGTTVVFQDARKFGRWQWSERLPPRLAALGPDPLEIGLDCVRRPAAVPPVAAQGAPPRPGVPAWSRQHLRGRGAVRRAPASPPERGWRRSAQGGRPPRGHPGRAAERHRRRRHQHPRLPRRPRSARRLPAADPDLRQGGHALPRLRDTRAAGARGAAEHAFLPALPAVEKVVPTWTSQPTPADIRVDPDRLRHGSGPVLSAAQCVEVRKVRSIAPDPCRPRGEPSRVDGDCSVR